MNHLPPPSPVHFYSLMERVVFGRTAAEVVPEEVERVGKRRVFVVTNRSLAGTSALGRIVASLGSRHAGVYSGVRAFAPRECVIEGALAAREAGADLLLAVGGGSVIDAAKTMLLCIRHGYEQTSQLDAHAGVGWNSRVYRPADADQWLRMIAVPTTFSAAEYTARGGATDTRTRKIEAFSDPMMIPQVVINAAEMTFTAPMPLLLSTGMKAIDHAVERLTSLHANAYSDATSALALRYLVAGLPAMQKEPQDIGAREGVQYGVFMSMNGLASGVNTGLSHGIGHQLGTYAGVSHGDTSCVLLPAVMRWIAQTHPERQRLVCEAMGQPGGDAASLLISFIESLGLPTRLRDVGVKQEYLQEVAERTMQDPLIHNCPRKVESATDVQAILESAW